MNTEQHTLIFNQISIDYTIRRSNRRRKGMAIAVTQQGVIVSVPMRAQVSGVHTLVEKHADWILRKLKQCQTQSHLAPPKILNSGTTVYYLGKAYSLKVSPVISTRKTMACLRGQCVEMFLPATFKRLPKTPAVKDGLIAFYRQKAEKILSARTAIFEEKIGVKSRHIAIANQKTQWGNCDRQGRLRFNWRLILLPLPLLDYVVVHELCHIVHLNHSKSFWRLVEKMMPDYRERRANLNKHTAVFMW